MSEQLEQQDQVVDAQAQVGSVDPSDLQNQIKLLTVNNAKLLDEKKATAQRESDLESRLKELETSTRKAKQAQAKEAGNYQALYEDLSRSFDERGRELAEKDSLIEQMQRDGQQRTIQQQFESALASAGVLNGQAGNLYKLKADKLRIDGDQVTAFSDGGVEMQLSDYVNSLKSPGSGTEIFFAGSGAQGMGSSGSTIGSGVGADNPWDGDPGLQNPSNLFRAMQLRNDNPQLAKRLEAQAKAG
jgi:hypothetical protein